MFVIRVLIAIAFSILPVAASAATAVLHGPDSPDDLVVGFAISEKYRLVYRHGLVRPSTSLRRDSCSCRAHDPYDYGDLPLNYSVDDDCYIPYDNLVYPISYRTNTISYSCSCTRDRPFERLVDDDIRGQMRLGDNLLTVVPLWEYEHAGELEQISDAAWEEGDCDAVWAWRPSGGRTGASPPSLSTASLVGAAGGGGGGSSGSSLTASSLGDTPAEVPYPTPIPAAGLMFLSALSLLGLAAGLRRRLAPNR